VFDFFFEMHEEEETKDVPQMKFFDHKVPEQIPRDASIPPFDDQNTNFTADSACNQDLGPTASPAPTAFQHLLEQATIIKSVVVALSAEPNAHYNDLVRAIDNIIRNLKKGIGNIKEMAQQLQDFQILLEGGLSPLRNLVPPINLSDAEPSPLVRFPRNGPVGFPPVATPMTFHSELANIISSCRLMWERIASLFRGTEWVSKLIFVLVLVLFYLFAKSLPQKIQGDGNLIIDWLAYCTSSHYFLLVLTQAHCLC
jgi:hypothetical protein